MSTDAVPTETPSEILNSLLDVMPRGAQAALARRLKVRPQTITKWLKGDVQVPAARWLDVEQALGVDPLTFARRTGILEHLPELADMEPDRLHVTWTATFGTPDQRSKARAFDPSAVVALTTREVVDRFNRKTAEEIIGRPEMYEMVEKDMGWPAGTLANIAARRPVDDLDKAALAEQVETLRAEIATLRSELDALRSLPQREGVVPRKKAPARKS